MARFLIGAILALGAHTAMGNDWPTYRMDAARSGYTSEAIPNQLRLAWVYRSQHAPKPAWVTSERITFDQGFQPIIVGETVLFGSSADDQLVALNAATGQLRWRFSTNGPIRFAPVGWQDRVFLASDDGWLYALNLSDGKVLWKQRGGPNDERVIGNERLISRWPIRGGPVVLDGSVYFAAGIWPSDGVFLHAVDAQTGKVQWTNKESGGLMMPQPHSGANAKSGVSPQGYLLADESQLFVPTGRAVPAAFQRSDGKLSYYHLQQNQKRGGSWAMLADRFLVNSGCLFDKVDGKLAAQLGHGTMVATPEGVLWANGRALSRYRWVDSTKIDRKGQPMKVRELKEVSLVQRDHTVHELIVAGQEAICGEDGRISAVDYTRQQNTWWSHKVDGAVLGLAAAGGRIVATTDKGMVYCFDGELAEANGTQERTASSDAPKKDESDIGRAAEEIIRQTNVQKGYCVDLGAGTGQLAMELARRTDLHIVAVEADPAKVAAARRMLSAAGLYGVRVSVLQGDPGKLSLPKYFANLTVSSRSLTADLDATWQDQMLRIQRPYGGAICTGRLGAMRTKFRGELKDAGSWTHQNGNAANTICSSDKIVKGPLRMFWFRDVDYELPNRHGQSPAPLVHRGTMIVGGVDGLCAVDAYNGTVMWTHSLPGHLRDFDGIHHDVGVGDTGGTFCMSDDLVFVKYKDRCVAIDRASGRKVNEFPTPVEKDAKNRAWGYLGYQNGLLYGSVANQAHAVSPRYKLSQLRTESVIFFAYDPATGKLKWKYQPEHSVRNNAIAIDRRCVYLIDRPIAPEDHIANPRRGGKHGPRLKPGDQPDGTLIALDAKTGDVKWKKSDDIFGTQLSVSEDHGVVLMYYQAVRHGFFKLPSEVGGRIAAFDAKDGESRWSHKADYKTRPLINGYKVYAQGGAWDLLTGAEIPFKLERSYGCGQSAASAHMMLFRSGTLGYLDLSRDAGTENVGGIRPSCWINAVPAGGLVLVPDGSAKCTCSYQMKAWFALEGSE